MHKFEVGEICEVAVDSDNYLCKLRIGDEVEVCRIGPFRVGEMASDEAGRNDTPNAQYEIRECTGECWFCNEPELRKLRPGNEASSWDECVWKPEGVTA